MAARFPVIIILFLCLFGLSVQGRERAKNVDYIYTTVSSATSATTVTSNVTGYWYIISDQDLWINTNNGTPTANQEPIFQNTPRDYFPRIIYASGDVLSRTPSSVKMILQTAGTTANVTVIVTDQ